MADEFLASNEFPGDGVTTLFNVAFKGNRPDAESGTVPYINASDVKAQQITPATATSPESAIDLTCTPVGPNQFNVTPVVPTGKIVRIYRATQDEYNLVDYQSLQTVGEADLDLANRQSLFIVQEAHDLAVRASEDAQDANTVAFGAVAVANAAAADAAEALSVANQALGASSAAVSIATDAAEAADAAEAHASAADAAAAAAQVAADNAEAASAAAVATANAAASDAATALATANGISATANQALTNSNTAIATANAAEATANAIAGTANSALSAASSAVSIANAANDTANGIAATADTALDNSAEALDTANDALALVVNKQNLNDNLTALSGLTGAADRVPYFTGLGALSLANFTAYGRSLAALTDSAGLKALANIPGRNVLINGAMMVANRGASVTVPDSTGLYGGPDRWICVNSAGGGMSQYVSTASGADPIPTIVQQVTATPTDLSTTHYLGGIQQRIEGYNARKLVGKALTLSFLFQANINGVYSVALRGGTTPQSWISTFNYTGGGAPQRFSFAIPAVPSAMNVVGNNSIGMELHIGAQNNGTYSTTTLGWQAGTFMKFNASTGWSSTTGNYISAGEVQLEIGPKSDFEHEDISVTLTRCQRYFEVILGTTDPGQGAYIIRPYKVGKRAQATITLTGGSLSGANFDAFAGVYGCRAPAAVVATGQSDFTLWVDAEL
ncbi:tail fiber assembly [Pseudomonas phage vB_PpuP-Hammaste-2]